MSAAHAGKTRRNKGSGIARLLFALLGVIALAVSAVVYLLYAPAPREPDLGARPEAGTIRVGGLDRSYLAYAPRRVKSNPPLVVVFHSSMQGPEGIRRATGYEFDRLADRHGFVVAYPRGYEGNWNDCRKAADYPARRLGVDDAGFFRALVARLRRERDVDPSRVFVAGLSGGGAFVYRLALEHPEEIAGAAVFAASLPTDANSDCRPSGRPVPMLIVNGTADPINPYAGGAVSMFGLASRGEAQSAEATASRFAALAGAAGPRATRLRPTRTFDPTWAERRVWGTPATAEVVLLSVRGGGHVVPQPVYRAPRLLGRTTSAINGPAEAWAFFSRQKPRG